MNWQQIFTSPHLADTVLGFVGLEAMWLVLVRRWPVGTVLTILLPGVCLMLALRAALAGHGWPWIALALAGSLAAHLVDLQQRSRRE